MTNREKLLQYIQSRDLITIATYDDKPAAAVVYYGVDTLFNFYIITPPSTTHGKNIQKNHKVAGVIVDTNQTQFDTKHKIGVQLYGTAHELTETEEMKQALSIWSRGKKDIVETYMKNISENVWQSRPFIIKPEWIKWFNEELYGDEGSEIFTF